MPVESEREKVSLKGVHKVWYTSTSDQNADAIRFQNDIRCAQINSKTGDNEDDDDDNNNNNRNEKELIWHLGWFVWTHLRKTI